MSQTINPEVVAGPQHDRRHSRPAIDQQIKKASLASDSTGVAAPRCFWKLRRPYEIFVIGAMLLLVAELVVGLVLRHWAMVSMAAVPLAYLGLYALFLASIDRYAFPAYPLAMAGAVAFPVMLGGPCGPR